MPAAPGSFPASCAAFEVLAVDPPELLELLLLLGRLKNGLQHGLLLAQEFFRSLRLLVFLIQRSLSIEEILDPPAAIRVWPRNRS
jgi:hypothetical protein